MSYLRYMYVCLFAYSGVQHILCCVFVLFFFVLCTLCDQFLWIVPSVFSIVYFQKHHLYKNQMSSFHKQVTIINS